MLVRNPRRSISIGAMFRSGEVGSDKGVTRRNRNAMLVLVGILAFLIFADMIYVMLLADYIDGSGGVRIDRLMSRLFIPPFEQQLTPSNR